MCDIGNETLRLIQQYDQAKSDAVPDINDVNEGMVPYDIHDILAPSPGADLDQYNIEVSKKVPSWLGVWFEEKGSKSNRKLVLKSKVKEVQLGDKIITIDHLMRFQEMNAGAIYQSETGAWRLFIGKDDVISYLETRVSEVLKPWGAYGDMEVQLARKYIYRTMNDTSIRENPFENSNPGLAAFRNGTYDFQTGQLVPNSSENYILNSHDYELDTTGKETPATDSLLQEMFGDADIFFKEFIGYGFYRSYRVFQHLVFLHGTGGEGKSTLLDFLTKEVYGVRNVSAVSPDELAGNRFKPAQLYCKSANIVADIPPEFLKNTAILKKLSGADRIDAEYKGSQGFTFESYAKNIFSANELPTFKDNSEGFVRRVVVVKLVNGNTRKNDFWKRHDMDEVRAERSSFVYQCMRLFQSAMEKNQMSLTERIIADRDEWVSANDYVGQFIEEACTIDTAMSVGEKTKVVMDEFKAYCQENNFSDKTSSQKLTTRLSRHGIVRKRGRRGIDDSDNTTRYMGLKLNRSYINSALYK